MKHRDQDYQSYRTRNVKRRVKDMPKDTQRERFKALSGHEPTDAGLEMGLDLSLL